MGCTRFCPLPTVKSVSLAPLPVLGTIQFHNICQSYRCKMLLHGVFIIVSVLSLFPHIYWFILSVNTFSEFKCLSSISLLVSSYWLKILYILRKLLIFYLVYGVFFSAKVLKPSVFIFFFSCFWDSPNLLSFIESGILVYSALQQWNSFSLCQPIFCLGTYKLSWLSALWDFL